MRKSAHGHLGSWRSLIKIPATSAPILRLANKSLLHIYSRYFINCCLCALSPCYLLCCFFRVGTQYPITLWLSQSKSWAHWFFQVPGVKPCWLWKTPEVMPHWCLELNVMGTQLPSVGPLCLRFLVYICFSSLSMLLVSLNLWLVLLGIWLQTESLAFLPFSMWHPF